MSEEQKEQKINEDGYAKMDREKMRYYHHRGPLGMVFGVLLFLLILGGVFALGRLSDHNRGFGSAELTRSVAFGAGRNQVGMMGGGYGQHMMNNDGCRSDAVGSHARIVGQISTVNSDNITVKDTDGTAYTVKIADDTSVRINGKIDKASNLKTSGEIVVIGDSNSDGSITATLIRGLQ